MTPLEVVGDDEFLQSLNDLDRKYRYLLLSNGLKVLLISDETTRTSAATMCVATGGIKLVDIALCLFRFFISFIWF